MALIGIPIYESCSKGLWGQPKRNLDEVARIWIDYIEFRV